MDVALTAALKLREYKLSYFLNATHILRDVQIE
jgi:hypothetical protein